MIKLPGNVLIIDDKFSEIFKPPPDNAVERTEYDNLRLVTDYCKKSGLAIVNIFSDNIDDIKKEINKYENIRLLILDLDLNGDNNVDEEKVFQILEECFKKFGYFLLIIYSSHSDEWDTLSQNIPEERELLNPIIKNLCKVINKGDNFEEKINEIINTNYSLNLIFNFESQLNKARDKAFEEFIDFDKNSWEKLLELVHRETEGNADIEITNIFLNILKQYLLESKYPKPSASTSINSLILQKLYKRVNYLENSDNNIDKKIIWTGNLYKTDYADESKKYILVISPECDIAQKKVYMYKVLYGFEVNNQTFKEYTIADADIPILTKRFTKKNGNWRSRSDIKKKINENDLPDYLLHLPFASENNKSLIFDFRTSCSQSYTPISRMDLIIRINDPLITDILDKFSNMFNRKGLLSFPYKDMQAVD